MSNAGRHAGPSAPEGPDLPRLNEFPNGTGKPEPVHSGILSLGDHEGHEESFAIDEGVLVKCGDEVLVATRNAYGETGGQQIDPAEVKARMAPDEEGARCCSSITNP